jgi:hypothetical protein
LKLSKVTPLPVQLLQPPLLLLLSSPIFLQAQHITLHPPTTQTPAGGLSAAELRCSVMPVAAAAPTSAAAAAAAAAAVCTNQLEAPHFLSQLPAAQSPAGGPSAAELRCSVMPVAVGDAVWAVHCPLSIMQIKGLDFDPVKVSQCYNNVTQM